jgi:hypothetical protein
MTASRLNSSRRKESSKTIGANKLASSLAIYAQETERRVATLWGKSHTFFPSRMNRMHWKVIAELSELNESTNSLIISPGMEINHPFLKQELMEKGYLRLGLLEVKIEDEKILAYLPKRRVPHVID